MKGTTTGLDRTGRQRSIGSLNGLPATVGEVATRLPQRNAQRNVCNGSKPDLSCKVRNGSKADASTRWFPLAGPPLDSSLFAARTSDLVINNAVVARVRSY